MIVRFSSQKLGRKNREHLQCAVISNAIRIKAAAWAEFARNRRESVAGKSEVVILCCQWLIETVFDWRKVLRICPMIILLLVQVSILEDLLIRLV